MSFLLWGGGALAISAGVSSALLLDAASAAPKTNSSGSVSTNGNGQDGGNNGRGGGNGAGTGAPGKALSVSATVPGGLQPGQSVPMTVTVTNPNSQGVRLTEVSAAVRSVTPSTCSAAWFSIPSAAPGVPLPAGASTQVQLSVSLQETGQLQDQCKNATYDFSFTAKADQA